MTLEKIAEFSQLFDLVSALPPETQFELRNFLLARPSQECPDGPWRLFEWAVQLNDKYELIEVRQLPTLFRNHSGLASYWQGTREFRIWAHTERDAVDEAQRFAQTPGHLAMMQRLDFIRQ